MADVTYGDVEGGLKQVGGVCLRVDADTMWNLGVWHYEGPD